MTSTAFEGMERLVREFHYVVAGWCCGALLLLSGDAGAAEFANLRSKPSQIEILSAEQGISISLDSEGKKVEIRWDRPGNAVTFQVKVDDSPYFRQPAVARSVTGRTLAIDTLESGLVPGITYWVLIEPGTIRASFRIRPQSWRKLLVEQDYLHKAWEIAGREWLSRHSGVRWNDGARKWEVDQQWPYGEASVGPQAYYIEHAARGGVNLALVGHDLQLMDELAGFYLAYLKRFTTLGDLRKKKSLLTSTELLKQQGADSARTLAWLEKVSVGRIRAREHTLGNSQFFHPPARLIRVISTLPESQRTPVMKEFVASYVPLIVRDHLLRLAYEAHWDYWGAKELPRELIRIWRAIIAAASRPKLSYQHAMLDRDLWLVATAAEMLGANACDPELVPLSPSDLLRVREIVQIGIQLFQTKRTIYTNTRNFQGEVVESASYFNGDFDDHPGMAYAEYTGKSFPSPAQKQAARHRSWDISHFYRVPVFLRALYDNRKATGVDFPQAHDIELVINQYIYKVFQGDYSRPLFNNFFDGHDGWYRVGYHGAEFGYPPSRDCDMRDSNRPCLTVAGVYGWGLLGFFHDDLMQLQQALIKLALSKDPEVVRFRERYYTYDGKSFSFTDAQGKLQYPFLLFVILSDMAGQLL